MWNLRTAAIGIVAIGVVAFGVSAAPAVTLFISEVAWGGTAASSQDEWIELANASEEAVSLEGWVLTIGESRIPLGVVAESTVDVRSTGVEPRGFLLLERTDDTTVADIPADILYKGSLSNTGANIALIDPLGNVVDEIRCAETGWPAGFAGDGSPAYRTMERVDPKGAGDAWVTHSGTSACGLDAAGSPICGTPRATNAAALDYECTPRVVVTEPHAARAACPVVLRWTAIDPDGNSVALRLRVSVRREGAETWDVVADNLTNQGTYAWNCSGVDRGVSYEILVEATDGDERIGRAIVGPFTLADS